MRLNLSSQIVLNKIPEKFYRPKSVVEQSEITRQEKIPTEIFPKMEEGVCKVADAIVERVLQCQRQDRFCVLGLGTGNSLTPIYAELISRYQQGLISFSNVVVFNAYEFFPLTAKTQYSAISQLRERLISSCIVNFMNNASRPSEV